LHFPPQEKGDALLNYENEIIATNDAAVAEGGEPLPYVVPPDNVRVAFPVAAVDGNLSRFPRHSRAAAAAAAAAFVEYLFSPAAQQEFVDAGFRPVRRVARPRAFPRAPRLASVETDLGGWAAVQAKFFDSGALLDGIMDEVAGRG
jgi:sulfate transport system substrate-binding protein